MSYKSPFLIVRNFLSPLKCEEVVEGLRNTLPNTDQRGNPTLTVKGSRLFESRMLPDFKDLLPDFENYYNVETKTTTPFAFEWYPTGYAGEKAKCDGYQFLGKRGKSAEWIRVKDYDFTVTIFLNDHSDSHNFDERFECRGGKLEFPTHDFGFNPTRGTMVIFPCRPQFINAVGGVQLGDMNMIRFHVITKDDYEYNPEEFKGGYKEWFSGL